MSNETDSWTQYWQAGQKTTFGSVADFRENPSLKALWADLLEADLGGKFLEIGCGNGALSLLLLQLADEWNATIDIHAIDSAKINNDTEQSDQVQFYSEMPVESMTFDDGVFDGAVSHFGFEYAALDAAINETHRVLKPGAVLTLISHHRSSWLSRESFDILRQLIDIEKSELLATQEKLLFRLNHLNSQSLDPSQDEQAEQLRGQLNETAEALQTSSKASAFDPTFTLQVITSALRAFKPEHRNGKSPLEYLSMLNASLSSHAMRLQTHKKAALSDEEWFNSKVKLSDAGFTIKRFEPAVMNGYHYGQLIQAVRD
jgi:ubiquinone/menaquinone biosynthesis C-methylase UbiE